MFRALFYPKKGRFYTANVRASVTNSMSASHLSLTITISGSLTEQNWKRKLFGCNILSSLHLVIFEFVTLGYRPTAGLCWNQKVLTRGQTCSYYLCDEVIFPVKSQRSCATSQAMDQKVKNTLGPEYGGVKTVFHGCSGTKINVRFSAKFFCFFYQNLSYSCANYE